MTPATRTIAVAVTAVWIGLAGNAVAQDFDLSWYTIDGGGGMFSTGGDFELSGTIGQPDASTVVMTGGDFALVGGFWAGVVVEPPPLLGDLNCDGAVDFDDINAFVRALVGQATYEARYPDCRWLNGDIDGDNDVNFDDISPFVSCLVHSGCP